MKTVKLIIFGLLVMALLSNCAGSRHGDGCQMHKGYAGY